MSKLHLALILHHHQPEGNFDHIIENAYLDAYAPFVEFLLEKPSFRVALHYSGPLMRWIALWHPEFIEKLKVLLQRNQIEVLSGSFGESILSIWDESNQHDQLMRMNRLLKELTGTNPCGFWLAERIWEPTLPSILFGGGYTYTILDDNHFQAAGVAPDELFGYYLSEHKGDIISIISSSNKLRYLIPFALVERLFSFLKQVYDAKQDKLIAMGDDGEKFGVWPGTRDWVYGEKWLEKFIDEVEKNKDWLELSLPAEYIKKFPPSGRLYLPTLSYFELMEWSLPSSAAVEYKKVFLSLKQHVEEELPSPYLRGGFWRNFLTKYTESNYMHKRLVWLYRFMRDNIEAINEEEREKFFTLICKAQCNDAYWHGVFSGLYAPHLRKAIWDNLLRAHVLIDNATLLKNDSLAIQTLDINCDGYAETMVSSKELVTVFSLIGGSVLEMSYKTCHLCFTSCLRRRFESYHLSIEENVVDNSTEEIKTIHHIHRAK
ncbi:MAG: hypothetical protein A2Y62_12855, partial [Candidatus Fischerbacteria bacterium RBG_13_37_8]